MDLKAAKKFKRAYVKRVRAERAELKAQVDGIVEKIGKAHGEGSLISFMEERVVPVEGITTGYGPLDDLLTGAVEGQGAARRTVQGTGKGMPKGRIIEIYGPESAGKTTLVLELIEAAQKAGMLCGFVDAEHALDIAYAANIGVDPDRLLLSQPDSAEEALQIVEDLLKADVGLVVVDSVAALVPQAEIEGEMGDAFVGLQARLMSQACRKLTAIIGKKNAIVIFINQLRAKINMGFMAGKGPTETTTGGNALKFYASIRIDIRKRATFKDKSGIRSCVKVVKNKVAPPFRECFVDIMDGQGITQAIGDFDPIFKQIQKAGYTGGKAQPGETTDEATEE